MPIQYTPYWTPPKSAPAPAQGYQRATTQQPQQGYQRATTQPWVQQATARLQRPNILTNPTLPYGVPAIPNLNLGGANPFRGTWPKQVANWAQDLIMGTGRWAKQYTQPVGQALNTYIAQEGPVKPPWTPGIVSSVPSVIGQVGVQQQQQQQPGFSGARNYPMPPQPVTPGVILPQQPVLGSPDPDLARAYMWRLQNAPSVAGTVPGLGPDQGTGAGYSPDWYGYGGGWGGGGGYGAGVANWAYGMLTWRRP